MRFASAFALAILLSSGCEGARDDYSDAPDLAAVRSAFHCARPSDAREERACAAVGRFEQAGPVTGFPSSGRRVYVGRIDCSTGGRSLAFSLTQLRAGPPPSSDVEVSHRPDGVVARTIKSVRRTPELARAAEMTLRALREGSASLGVPPELTDGGLLPVDWAGWLSAAPADATPVADVARSDGQSLLWGPGRIPAWWDDAEPAPPYAYLRQIDDELIYVRPPTGVGELGHEACVHHSYVVPGQ